MDERQPYSLAVSLHAATQAERMAIVPAARAWPLDELIAAGVEAERPRVVPPAADGTAAARTNAFAPSKSSARRSLG